MPEAPWPQDVELSAHLAHLDTVQMKVLLPAPVVVLLSDLLQSARIYGPRLGTITPGEVAGAALLAAMPPGTALAKAVGDYRETRAHEVLTQATTTSGLFTLPGRDTLGLR
jgi:hypothetical protein